MTLIAPHSTSTQSWTETNSLDATLLDPFVPSQSANSQTQFLALSQTQQSESADFEADIERFARSDAGDRPISRARTNRSKGLKQTIRGKKKRILGTGHNDLLDASKGKGRNVLLGKGGNDKLKGKAKDRLLGGGGRDRLDTRKGRKNMLKGGGGNDVLFAGKQDTAFGNGGADKLDASKGKGRNTLKGGGGPDLLIGKMGDRLVGGNGNDEFVIINRTLPAEPLIIQDFQQGSDRLGVRNVSEDLQFGEFAFRKQGQNTVVSVQGEDIAILENVTMPQLQAPDFAGLAPSPSVAPSASPPRSSSPVPIPSAVPIEADAIAPHQGDDNTHVTIRRSNQYSVVALDAQNILLQFDVSGLNDANTFIPDLNPSSSVGVFPDAIQNYVSGQGVLPFGVDPEPFVANGSIALDAVDLRIELVQDANRNAFVTGGRDTLEYVFIDASGSNPSDNELLRLSLDFTSALFSGIVPTFDQQQAINSLEYVVQNDLLAYTTRVQVAGNQLFSVGSVQNTQPSKTYTQTSIGESAQSSVTQFRLVGSQQELTIEDQNGSATAGLFVNAIEDFSDELTGQSFALGNLSANRVGDEVTYAIANTTISQTASLTLSGTAFDPDLAVNNLSYILTNDLLQLAFFS